MGKKKSSDVEAVEVGELDMLAQQQDLRAQLIGSPVETVSDAIGMTQRIIAEVLGGVVSPEAATAALPYMQMMFTGVAVKEAAKVKRGSSGVQLLAEAARDMPEIVAAYDDVEDAVFDAVKRAR